MHQNLVIRLDYRMLVDLGITPISKELGNAHGRCVLMKKGCRGLEGCCHKVQSVRDADVYKGFTKKEIPLIST
jgi:hypothetical protein